MTDDPAKGGLYAAMQSSPRGLSDSEAAARRSRDGPNVVAAAPARRLIPALLKRFANPLVLVLLFAAGIAALTHEQASFLIIVAIVSASVLIDFVQERRAEAAAETLRRRVTLRVQAMRDGSFRDIPAADLVTGDVVRLSAGDLVPADCRLLQARDLFVNEALLTGESYPAEKSASGAAADPLAATADDELFMGSSVVSGSGTAIVASTGAKTRFGGIASALHKEPAPTALAVGIRNFGYLIIRLTVLLVLFVLLVNLLLGRPLLESFLFALALAVGLTPELLPMVVSVTLARGAVLMAREQVIVKSLPAVHELGSMDVLCSDKTGTLTEARIKLVRQTDIAGQPSNNVLKWAFINAACETGLKSPLDDAIMEAEPLTLQGWSKIDEVPFDFERRRVSVLAEHDGLRFLIVKGAPEDVLQHCSRYQPGDSDTPQDLDAAVHDRARETLERLGDDGFRVLGIAWREVERERDHASVDDESGLTFAGFAAFLDPPKASARPALQALADLGVSVRIITGDNERVTRHVCDSLGHRIDGLINGPELSALSDEALSARLQDTNVFCRVTPVQKARIIRALRRKGHVVGYLGDGINDAPSLQAANVGLSVEGAVDVAREAAAMILLRQDLNVLVEGVREGRRTFANIMKYVMMGTSSNFGNMISMAGAVLLLPFLPMLPVQILLNNLLYDASEIAIPLDRVDDDMITHPRQWDMTFVRNFMLVFGPVSSIFDFLVFATLLLMFHATAPLFQTGWFMMSLASQVLVIFIMRTRRPPWASRPHPALVASSVGIVLLAIILPYTPLASWVGFVAPPISMLLALAATTTSYLVMAEIVKRQFFKFNQP